VEQAAKRKQAILDGFIPEHISADVDASIRQSHHILLSKG